MKVFSGLLGDLGGEFGSSQVVGGASFSEAWEADEIAHGINPREAADILGVCGCPSEGHESAATPSEEDGLGRELGVFGEVLKKSGEEALAIGTAIGFADIDARDA